MKSQHDRIYQVHRLPKEDAFGRGHPRNELRIVLANGTDTKKHDFLTIENVNTSERVRNDNATIVNPLEGIPKD